MHYTTIEQSKKLMELGLSPDTADMYWAVDANVAITEPYITKTEHETLIPAYKGAIPCWSVGALIRLMPYKITTKNGDYNLSINKMGIVYSYYNSYQGGITFTEKEYYGDLSETCFNMVVWLLENNYIEKRPELVDSEGEKIRKAISYAISQSTHSDGTLINGVSSEEALTWLEKQDAQAIKEALRTEYEKGRADAIAKMQNPDWSEEDEKIRKEIINFLLQSFGREKDNYEDEKYTRWFTWLEKQGEHKCDCKYVGCHVNNVKRWCHKKQAEIFYEKCNTKCSEYLKCGEQKPAKWSEGDENCLYMAIVCAKTCGYPNVADWLKSLRPQPKQDHFE